MTSGPVDTLKLRTVRPWLAFVLSFMAPGLGHVYAGRIRRAGIALLGWIGAAGLAVVLYLIPFGSFLAILGGTFLGAFAWFVVAFDAAAAARRAPPRVARPWTRFGVLLVYQVTFGFLSDSTAHWIRTDLSEPFRMPSGSMQPTLLIGDHFFAAKTILRRREPARGDVVVFWVSRDGTKVFPVDERPELPHDKFVKRIIGLPGDRLSIVSGHLIVNGVSVPDKPLGVSIPGHEGKVLDLFEETLGDQRFTIAHDPKDTSKDIDSLVISPDRYFLLGDNREESYDGRYWGTVDRASIIGVATHVYFSWDTSKKIRWTRIGDLVR